MSLEVHTKAYNKSSPTRQETPRKSILARIEQLIEHEIELIRYGKLDKVEEEKHRYALVILARILDDKRGGPFRNRKAVSNVLNNIRGVVHFGKRKDTG